MELRAVPQITPEHVEKLAEAGVPHAEALAVWQDLAPLADRADLDVDTVASYRDAARARIERAFAEAGVGNAEALATARLDELATKTGIERPYLEHYQRKARESLGKVVLVDGAPVARVHVGDATHHAVALLTAPAGEDEDEVLGRAGGDAVLLRPAAEVVPALIGGVTHRALPLYKERRREGGDLEEVRVRVMEIREVSAAQAHEEKKSGIGRLFSKRK